MCKLCYSNVDLPSITCKHVICGTCSDKIKLYYNENSCVFCENERNCNLQVPNYFSSQPKQHATPQGVHNNRHVGPFIE